MGMRTLHVRPAQLGFSDEPQFAAQGLDIESRHSKTVNHSQMVALDRTIIMCIKVVLVNMSALWNHNKSELLKFLKYFNLNGVCILRPLFRRSTAIFCPSPAV